MSFRLVLGRSRLTSMFTVPPEWLIEVVSLTECDAVKDATEDDGLFTSVVLSSLSDDPRHSEEGDILRAMEHIADKAENSQSQHRGFFM